ncbi:unnamed protein product [Clavelina lepadiformis]|uniref:Tetratricopeptide repeat protein 32 n=1 Tax=Clavelina lepadiformis TaxID=159417 RepID=A0ABP0GZM3_CLALP
MLEEMSCLLKEADLKYGEKDYDTAEELYSSVINKCKEAFPDLFTTSKQPSEKEQVIKIVSHSLNNRGQIKYLRVDFEEAVEDYTDALSLDKRSEVLFYNRGLIHYRLGRYTQALSDFYASLEIQPHFKDSIEAIRIAKMEQSQKGDREI